MAGIKQEIRKRVRETLIDSDAFQSTSKLKSVFVDERLYLWRDKLPECDTLESRVDCVIDFLHNKYNTSGDNALTILLNVLSQQISLDDFRHQTLTKLVIDYEKDQSDIFIRRGNRSPASTTKTTTCVKSGKSMVEITMEGDLSSLSSSQKQSLLMMLALNLGIAINDMKILSVSAGSIVVRIEMPTEATEKLQDLYEIDASIVEELKIKRVRVYSLKYSQFTDNLLKIGFVGIWAVIQWLTNGYISYFSASVVSDWRWIFRMGQILAAGIMLIPVISFIKADPQSKYTVKKRERYQQFRGYLFKMLLIGLLFLVVVSVFVVLMTYIFDKYFLLIFLGLCLFCSIFFVFERFSPNKAPQIRRPSVTFPTMRAGSLSRPRLVARGASIQHGRPPKPPMRESFAKSNVPEDH